MTQILKNLLFIFFLLSSAALWSQQESSVLVNKNTFSSRDGYLISSPYHSIYDTDGWLWVLGENKLSNKYIFGDKEIIMQRFDGANFFTLKLPETTGKKIKEGHFFKYKKKGLYLKLYYQVARAELFFIDTETLEIRAVDAYNTLDPKYLISKEYKIRDIDRLVITSKDKFYSAELDKLSLKFIDSVPFNKPVTKPFLADIRLTDEEVIVKLLFQKDGLFLDKNGKIIKKLVQSDFVNTNEHNFYPDKIHNAFKSNNIFYFYFDDYENIFKYENKKFIEQPNTSDYNALNKELNFNNDFENAFSEEVVSDYSDFKIYRFNNFKPQLINEIKIKNYSEIAYKDFSEDLIVLDKNTLDSYSFIKSEIKTFLKGKSIRAIKEIENGKCIVATDNEGVYVIDTKNNTEKKIKFLLDNNEISMNYSRDIYVKNDNTIIINDANNLYTLDADYNVIKDESIKINGEEIIKIKDTIFIANQHGKIFKYSINEKRYTKIAGTDDVKVMEFATDGKKLYATSSKGIFEYGNGDFKTYEFENEKTENLLSINYLEGFGILVSTKFGKLYTFNTTTKKLELFYDDPLSTSIVGVVADDNGSLWLNTYVGIVIFNPSTKNIVRYTTKDGVYELEGNRFSTYKDDEGNILMGSYKGLSLFNPNELMETTLNAQPQFSSISFFNDKKNRWEINSSPRYLKTTKEIVLPSEYRRFSATMSVFGQLDLKDLKYRCRLLDKENNSDWFTSYSGKEILFGNLAPGDYTLQVELVGISGNKIGETIELKVISEMVFYKTWWFLGLMLLLAPVIITYIFYQYKVKQDLFAKNKIATNEAKVKSAMMLEIHHRIKNNLQIVSGLLGLQMLNSTNEELNEKLLDSRNRIESIADIHNLLYNSSNQNDIFVKENIESSVAYYKKLYPLKVKYHLDIADSIIIGIDEATPFSLLLNELVNNSNKHAFAEIDNPEIYIGFNEQDGKYHFEYSDNGIFKVKDDGKGSMGMSIIEMMGEQLHGDLKIENTTNFKLTLLFSGNE